MQPFAENTIQIVVSAYFEEENGQIMTKGWVTNLSKVESKLCPSMLCNTFGQILDSKNGNCLSSFFLLWQISFSLQKDEFFRKKKKKRGNKKTNWTDVYSKKAKSWTDVWLKEGQILDRFLTLQHTHIYIYIYLFYFFFFFWGGGGGWGGNWISNHSVTKSLGN